MATMLDAVINLKDNFSSTLKQVEKNVGNFSRTSKRMGRDIQRTGRNVQNVGGTLTKSLTVPLLGVGAAAIKTAVDSEDAFVGIRKTVDATEKEFKKIRDSLDDMSLEIPIDKNELYAIGEAAGQLGVKKQHIVEFTDAVAKLGVTTNLTSEQASADLAKFANIMDMDLSNMDKLGSTIVDLGNNLATTEADIVNMSMRIAGAGKQIGLTESDVLSFSGALSSVGIEAEAGGSSFSKLLVNMQLATEKGGKGLKDFANVAGMTANEFKTSFKDDASEAVAEFIEGLGEIENTGGSVIGVLDEMGIREIRMRDTLLRAAGASDLFSEALGTGTKAWEENVAMAREAEQKFGTTASKIQLVKNQVKLLADKFGQILLPSVIKVMDKITLFTDKLNNLDDSTKKQIIKFVKLAIVIGPALMIIGKMTSGVGKLVMEFGFFAARVKTLGLMGAIFTPGVQVVLILAAIVAAAILVYKNWDKLKAIFIQVKDTILDFTGITSENIEVVKEVFKSLANTIWEKVQEVIQKFEPLKESFAQLFSKLRELFSLIMPFLMPILAFIGAIFVGKIILHFQTMFNVVMAVIEGIAGFINGLLLVFQGFIDFFIGVFTGDWSRAWEGIQTIFSGVVEIITSVWETFVGFVTAPVEALIDILDSVFHEKIGKAKEVWGDLKEFFKHPIKGTVNLVKKGAGWLGSKLGIGNNYEGTDNWRGGLTWVHEKGAEIMDLPSGTRIYPHDKSLQMAREEGMKKSPIQQIVQKIQPINIPKVKDSTQVIKQVIKSARIPKLKDINQNIKQNLKETVIPKISDVTQNIKQNLISAKIPKLSDMTQTIKQKVRTATIEPLNPIKQDIIPISGKEKETKVIEKKGGKKVLISIPKLADQIIIREDADIDKIAKVFVREIEKVDLNTA